uniref:YTH domain-containing protein n=1 Tax=Steinernema glaseri TaxID=37863 RepID=A0A1I7YIP3_9BILA
MALFSKSSLVFIVKKRNEDILWLLLREHGVDLCMYLSKGQSEHDSQVYTSTSEGQSGVNGIRTTSAGKTQNPKGHVPLKVVEWASNDSNH